MRRAIGGVIAPSSGELKTIGKAYGFELDDTEAAFFAGQIEGMLASYRRVAELPDTKPGVRYPRTPGRAPETGENPFAAWYWRCSVKGAPEGKLAGKAIAVKDPISVAGVPCKAGSAVFESFIPDTDATVVSRILDAGGEISGKAVCEDMCISGGSVTSAPLPVRNPRNREYSAGGSSSGCAALVASGASDMTLGADQGGSIRIPAALCGVVGLKPSYGLVPYTGIFPIENTLDHVGPICRSVSDAALLLEVIAGPDGMDPRQGSNLVGQAYTKSLTGRLDGLRVGVLAEGFDWEAGTRETDDVVRSALARFEKAGARVRPVSVPAHRDGVHIYTPILLDGGTMQMVRGHGFGTGWKGHYPTQAMEFYGRSRKVMADSLSTLVKLMTLCGHYMHEKYNGHYYARAQNQMRALKAEYDKALVDVDVLVMPTTAPEGKALPITANPSPEQLIVETFRYHFNCCPFDGTGHPALSVPAGNLGGLPVGLMIVGRYGEDSTVLRVAHAFEQEA